MPPRVKRKYDKKQLASFVGEQNEDEKENKQLETGEKNTEKGTVKLEEFDKLLKLPEKEALNFKPLSFWSKKLQALEAEKNKKEKKYNLYDFSETDDSQSPCKRKKPKRKAPPKKKTEFPIYNKPIKKVSNLGEKKKKQMHVQFKEKIKSHKEKEKLENKNENFTFSTGMPALGITSTPAVNKNNLVGASSFSFISPIVKEERPECLNFNNVQCTPLKSKIIKRRNSSHSQCRTPKIETSLKSISCKRVLRSGKVINT